MTLGSLVTILILALCFALIIRYMVRKHKNGGSSCGCGCSGCAHNASSHGACSCQSQQTH